MHGKSSEEIEDDTWADAKEANTLEVYETYLSGYPNGRYAVQAKMKLAALKNQAQQQVAAQLEQQKQEAERQRQLAESERQRQAEAARINYAQQATNQQSVLSQGYVSQGGLTWMPVSFQKTWPDANFYCNNTSINGQTGWRLPTEKELIDLHASGAMNGQGWALSFTWTSEPLILNGSTLGHKFVRLNDGGRSFNNDKDHDTYVTCVR